MFRGVDRGRSPGRALPPEGCPPVRPPMGPRPVGLAESSSHEGNRRPESEVSDRGFPRRACCADLLSSPLLLPLLRPCFPGRSPPWPPLNGSPFHTARLPIGCTAESGNGLFLIPLLLPPQGGRRYH